MAHDPPLVGHMGPEKTLARITPWFYWPGIRAQVQRYCSACRECQLHQGLGPKGGPLQPMPLTSTPFERIDIDIVGPLFQTSSRHKFILVWINYVTHYPEAIPLRNIMAETIARELTQVFTRVGIPKQVVTDQGVSFMSEVLQAVWQFLGVEPLRMSVYHTQTNGLVERFNESLKRMLRKFIGENGRDWPQWIPYPFSP